jgi:DNA-directed RNA polymerase specialized sigma24 family protein
VFPTTRWTLIRQAGGGGAERRAALEALLGAYWRPAYVFLRRKGLAPEAAEDGVQDLFVRLIEGEALQRLDPARGRFRSYLLTALQNDMIKGHEKRTAKKRGGGAPVVPLDALDAERDLPALPADPDRAFDRQWALGVMERAGARLAAEFADGRRQGNAEAVLRFFSLDEAPSYAEAAASCGMTPVRFKAALHRARVRFRTLVLEELRETVGSADDAAGEMRALFAALQG